MKKWIALFLAAVLLGTCASALAEEETEEVFSSAAKAAVLIAAADGRVLYEKNAYQPLPMASTTKVMTALMALEYGKLDEMVTTSKNAYGVPGTSIYLGLNESLSLHDMLYGLLLSSGNDAAVAIAEHVSGTVDAFCAAMTARAAELGCVDTVFKNPHGLPNNAHHTTAYDLALITREAMTHPLFRQIVSTQKANIPWEGRGYDRVLSNKNRLLSDYSGATGVKTGYTKAAGRCLVFSADREGLEVIGVVLNCGDWFNEAERIMDDGFARYQFVSALKDGELVGQIPVTDGESTVIDAVLDGWLEGVMLKTAAPSVEIALPQVISGGAEKGEKLGIASLYEDGKLVSQTDIVAKEAVYRRTFRYSLRRTLGQWLSKEW